ncbi:trypsin inhibitor-like [Bombyx mori]|uniref:BPTI/Kunitz inhibitor domain-containing protein n=1 Tax=Bombyx mori TaxID=7091 RepID=A0A8R2AKM6_BOMMO|nr:trypsin inhibitor-like [Bombyx mori]
MTRLALFSFAIITLLYSFSDAFHSDCLLPIKPGFCMGYFERYAFDSSLGKCVAFIYGGCGHNANNFESQTECENKCSEAG